MVPLVGRHFPLVDIEAFHACLQDGVDLDSLAVQQGFIGCHHYNIWRGKESGSEDLYIFIS